MCRENKFLKAAIRKIDSANSDYSIQHRHAAIIVKSGRVLSSGVNRIKTHPDAVVEADDGEVICKSIHAEMDAILKVKNNSETGKFVSAKVYWADGRVTSEHACYLRSFSKKK